MIRHKNLSHMEIRREGISEPTDQAQGTALWHVQGRHRHTALQKIPICCSPYSSNLPLKTARSEIILSRIALDGGIEKRGCVGPNTSAISRMPLNIGENDIFCSMKCSSACPSLRVLNGLLREQQSQRLCDDVTQVSLSSDIVTGISRPRWARYAFIRCRFEFYSILGRRLLTTWDEYLMLY